jgi:hypothetical protein
MEHRTRIGSTIFKTLNIVLPAVIALLAFSDINYVSTYLPWLTEGLVRLTIGIFGFLLFLVDVLAEVFDVSEKHAKHREAINLYSDLLRDLRTVKLDNESPEMRDKILQVFNQRYLQTTITTVNLTHKEFTKAEAHYLRYRAERHARRDDPFAWPWKVRKVAKQKAKDLLILEGTFHTESQSDSDRERGT